MQLDALTPIALAIPLVVIAPVAAHSPRALVRSSDAVPCQVALADAVARLAAHSGPELVLAVTGGDGSRSREVSGRVSGDVQDAAVQSKGPRVRTGVDHEPRSHAASWTVIDPVADVGFVHARWKDRHGRWSYTRETLISAHSTARPTDGELGKSTLTSPPSQRGSERGDSEPLNARVLHL